MNIIVHLLIAQSIRKTVYRQIGERLSLSGFLYGNILPDLSAEYDGMPHYLKNSLGFVVDSAARFSNGENARLSSFDYAREAGVITHYLSDFFCYAHSERYTYGICRHHLYELFLLLLFRKGLLFYQKRKTERPLHLSELEVFIRENFDDYNNKRHLKIQDIYFAINVSAAATVCLMKERRCETDRKSIDPDMQPHDLFELGDELNESGKLL